MHVMSRAKGLELYKALTTVGHVGHGAYLSEDRTRPEPIGLLEELSTAAADLAAQYPGGIPRGQDCEFDGAAAELVHRAFQPHLNLVGIEGLWIRLSFGELFEFTRLRHSVALELEDGKYRLQAAENFGVSTPRNGFLFRSWLRGDIGFDPSDSDPYRLARLGSDVDFWRSHILRVDYGGCRTFARTFLRYTMDPTAPYYRQLTFGQSGSVRTLAKLVNRRYLTTPLNVLNEDESVRLLDQLCLHL